MEITKTSTASKGSRARVVLLAILAVCCLVTIVGLAIGLGVCRNKASTSTEKITSENDLSEQQNNNGSSTNACLKGDCAMKAAEITSLGEMLARMDLTVDPCDDFYQYACGTFSKPEKRNPDQRKLSTTETVRDSTNLLLLAQLTHEGNTYRGKPSTAVTKVKAFYNECMSDTQDDKTGRELLFKLIKEVGLWPISSDPLSGNWSAGTWIIENSMAEAAVLLKESFLNIDLTSMEDPRNSSNYIIAIYPGKPVLGQAELYKNESTVKLYKEYIIEILTLLYGTEKTDMINYLADTIYKFESSLASIYLTKTELYQMIDQESFTTLGKISDAIPFVKLVNLLEMIANKSGTPTTIDQNTEVLASFKHLKKLNSLVRNATDINNTISAYLVWTVVYEFVPYAGSSFRKAWTNFYMKLGKFNSHEADVHWKRCLRATVQALGFAAGAIYTEENVEDDDKQKIDEILQLTRQEFVDGLPKVEWLQEETRVKAAQKANAIKWQIEFPQYLDTAEKLDSYYNDFYVTEGYFRNIIAQRRFQTSQIFSKYGKPVDKMQWKSMPTDINSEYMTSTNQIFIFAGYMQKPMFDRSFPTSMIHGAMGTVIGHELIHGFDTNGKNYNAEGKLENWWDSLSSAEYNKKAACFIKQYSEENFHGFPINGTLTVGENIADCGGIKLAYNVYLKDVGSQANRVDQLLPGLNMTGKKQFFVGYSQMWCSNFARSAAEEFVKDVHSPGPQRVNVVLRNTPQFAEAFNCPDGSKMNPSEQCSLW